MSSHCFSLSYTLTNCCTILLTLALPLKKNTGPLHYIRPIYSVVFNLNLKMRDVFIFLIFFFYLDGYCVILNILNDSAF